MRMRSLIARGLIYAAIVVMLCLNTRGRNRLACAIRATFAIRRANWLLRRVDRARARGDNNAAGYLLDRAIAQLRVSKRMHGEGTPA